MYFRTMFRALPPAAVALALLLCSCEKDEGDEGYRAAGITFRSDSGYTHTDDTVGVGDTLHIGAMVAEGSERLQTVYVEFALNGGNWVKHDTVAFSQNPLAVDVRPVMGTSPRTETWSILAVERNGNTTRRNLHLTVTE